MKTFFSICLLYLFLVFVIFCIPTGGVYATNCPAGSNTSSTNFDLSGLTCTLANTADGPADGDVVLNASTSLTLLEGQALIFPSGKKITIGGGTINLSKTGLGAKIIKGVMCLTDADGDYYPASNAISDRTRGPCTDTKKSIADIKAQNPTVTADCNDLSYSAINTCCIANGDACSSDGACCNSICGTDADSDLLFSAAAAHTGTCQATAYAYTDTNDSQYCPSGYNPAGTCDKCVTGAIANQTGSEDVNSECAASYNACSGNNRIGPDGYCSGTGMSCKTTGLSDLCATRSTCQTGGGCSGGSCIAVTNQSYGQDLYGECTASYNACSGNNRIGPDGNCDGSGACNTGGLSSACATRSTCQTGGGCSGGSCVAVTNQTSAQDLYSECAGLSCSSYYFGWSSNVCYYMLNVSAANHVCNGSGACKTAADQCPSSTQGSSTGVTRTTCKTMVGCTGATAGSLGNVTINTDPYSDCAVTACGNGNCNGSGACAAIDYGEGGQAACKYCNGTLLTAVNFADNTQDAQGTNLCNATCKKCSSGSCVNQLTSEDLFSQCAAANTAFVLANNGTNNTCATMCGWYQCNNGTCNGSGACDATTLCVCASVGTDAGGTNTCAKADATCTDYCSKTCSLILAPVGNTCQSRANKWTNCKCQL